MNPVAVSSRCIVLALLVPLAAWFFPYTAHAQARAKGKPAAPAAPSATPRLEIRLVASRGELTAGGAVGIVGTLTNSSSDSTIYLSQQSVTLMQPPELEGPRGLLSWPAYFPTERQFDDSGRYLDPDTIVLALRPGQSTTIGWAPTPVLSSLGIDSLNLMQLLFGLVPSQIRNEMRFMFFTPGDYQISVQAKYWTDATRPRFGYLTATETMTVRMLAPQFVILFGAALGGLIAYTVFPSRRTTNRTETETVTPTGKVEQMRRSFVWARKHVPAAALAMLWSAVATILLSRLSETQLPIRVTVADFWGAIAIGLAAQYAGSKGFEHLIQTKDEIPKTTQESKVVGSASGAAAATPAKATP